MKFKAVIFDLDGTIVPSVMEGMPSREAIKAVKKLSGKIKLSSASGRSVIHCREIWKALDLKDRCIVNGGSQIVNPQTEEIIWEQSLPDESIVKILEATDGYTDNFGINGLKVNSKIDLDRLPKKANIVVALGVKKNRSEELVKRYSEMPGLVAHILPSWIHSDCWDIHVTHKLATKKHAIEKLIKVLGVNKKDVIGIGDGNNDMPLFESVGYKVAMGNSVEGLKKAADYVTDNFENEGFAKFIYKKLY